VTQQQKQMLYCIERLKEETNNHFLVDTLHTLFLLEVERGVDIAARLESTLPCLFFSQQVHQDWIDWYQKYPDEIEKNHTAGGPDHHEGAVEKYNRRISAVQDAIEFLRR
jgi:hypothetical protein